MSEASTGKCFYYVGDSLVEKVGAKTVGDYTIQNIQWKDIDNETSGLQKPEVSQRKALHGTYTIVVTAANATLMLKNAATSATANEATTAVSFDIEIKDSDGEIYVVEDNDDANLAITAGAAGTGKAVGKFALRPTKNSVDDYVEYMRAWFSETYPTNGANVKANQSFYKNGDNYYVSNQDFTSTGTYEAAKWTDVTSKLRPDPVITAAYTAA